MTGEGWAKGESCGGGEGDHGGRGRGNSVSCGWTDTVAAVAAETGKGGGDEGRVVGDGGCGGRVDGWVQ